MSLSQPLLASELGMFLRRCPPTRSPCGRRPKYASVSRPTIPIPAERKFFLDSGRPARSRVFALPPTFILPQYTFFLPRVRNGAEPVGVAVAPRFQFFGRVSLPISLAFWIFSRLL